MRLITIRVMVLPFVANALGKVIDVEMIGRDVVSEKPASVLWSSCGTFPPLRASSCNFQLVNPMDPLPYARE